MRARFVGYFAGVGLLLAAPLDAATVSTFTVSAQVVPGCQVVSGTTQYGTLDYGSQSALSTANNYLAYDIFKSAGTVRWGAAGSARRASADAGINPGAGTGTGSLVFNYNARVYTDQPTPPAASYSDSVVLDVQF